jgi:hypothetical protein
VFGVHKVWEYRTHLYIDGGSKAVRKFGRFRTYVRLTVSLCLSVFVCGSGYMA